MKKNIIYTLIALSAMLALIIDNKTAITGALHGINMCIYSVIPSLFPLMVLSIYIVNGLQNSKFNYLNGLSKICRVNQALTPLLIVGLIGGYPIGAQCVSNEYKAGHITKDHAHRILGFCSNAGPSFIFGFSAALFDATYISLLLWLIIIISSILTAVILPGSINTSSPKTQLNPMRISDALRHSIRSITYVCGWVILFKTLTTILANLFMNNMPVIIKVIVSGFLELVNGMSELRVINNNSIKFILCSAFLAFGGVCVCMQTLSVIDTLEFKYYLKGKIIQTCISVVLAYIATLFIFPGNNSIFLISVVCLFTLLIIIMKIVVDFRKKMIYNTKKRLRG